MYRLQGEGLGGPFSAFPRRNSGLGYSRYECREIFRDMVRAELRGGDLGRRRRRRLVQYAARLQLSAVVAGLVVTETREAYEADRTCIEGERSSTSQLRVHHPPARRGFVWIAIGVLCMTLAGIALYMAW